MLPVKDICNIKMVKNSCTSWEAADYLSREGSACVMNFHKSMDCYAPTPLIELKDLAKKLGVKAICVKDESKRFGLKAFKGLGGSYVVFRVVCKELGLDPEKTSLEELKSEKYKDAVSKMVFITATDGNHGKGVSWASGLLGCKSYVFMPKGSVEVRAQAIRDAGLAEVTITEMGYDDTVRYAKSVAEKNGWHLVQDTSWEGYETVPGWIVQAYTTMAFEALDQLGELGYEGPTHVFLQAGVGSMAGSVLGSMRCTYGREKPVVAIVESMESACIFESAAINDTKPHPATGSEQTIMAGLNCSEPCEIVWPILRDQADFYFACPDSVTVEGMRLLAKPIGEDQTIVSGESGAVTSGLVSLILKDDKLAEFKNELNFNQDSVILLFSTEGDTDPQGYRNVVDN